MKKLDFILIGLISLIFLFFALYRHFTPVLEDAIAEVSVNGAVILVIDLNQDDFYELQGENFPFSLKSENGSIRMVHTPCPNQICVNTGAINKGGFSIICVPNRVSVVIKEKNSQVNAVSQ